MRKFLCVSADGYPYEGSSEFSFVRELCVALAEENIDITIIAPQSLFGIFLAKKKKIPEYYEDVSNSNIIRVYRPFSWSLGSRFLKYQYKTNIWAIKKTIKDHNLHFDAYYGHFWHCAYQLYPIAKYFSKPLYVASGESHIFLADDFGSNKISPFLKYVRNVICVSSKNRDDSISLGYATADKCIVLPNGFNNKKFYPVDNKVALRKEFGLPEEAFLVAFTGAFIERKGADRVSDAIKSTGETSIKGIFIGKPQEGNAPYLPDPKTVAFSGYVSHEKIRDLLCCADIFVLPTYQEGCCNAIVEAMACGLPIVSSDRSFNYDILDDSNSIMVEPSDVGAISNAIIKLKSDEHLRQKLREGSIRKSKSLSIEQRAKIIKGILFEDIS